MKQNEAVENKNEKELEKQKKIQEDEIKRNSLIFQNNKGSQASMGFLGSPLMRSKKQIPKNSAIPSMLQIPDKLNPPNLQNKSQK